MIIVIYEQIFSILKIISAIPLPRFERGPSKLPFAYSLYAMLFLICSKMATNLFERHFQKTIDIFKVNFLNTM